MEILIFIGFVILLLVINGQNNSISEIKKNTEILKTNLRTYQDVVLKRIEELTINKSTITKTSDIEDRKSIITPESIIKNNIVVVEEKKIPDILESKVDPILVIAKRNLEEKRIIEENAERIKELEIQQDRVNLKSNPIIEKEPELSFFDKNPDLEKFIGENLMNKIGIGILVLGIGFFVKYAISQGWINEIFRTAIGIACGGILIGLAHKLRKTFASFSSVLVGGGLAILYFTITIAFHEYHVFEKIPAFIIMMCITSFGVLLSVSYDRKELAILALIGGFTSPFMVSTGEGSYIALFTYVSILNLGMLSLAYFKKWNAINVISYVFTIILFGAWFVKDVIWASHPSYIGAFVFSSLFYLIFFLMNIINNVKESRKFNGLEISILLSNTFLYFTIGLYIFGNVYGGDYKGLFTILVALFNFGFAYALYKNDKVDKTLVYLLIGLVLTFLSLAAPIQLQGNQITIFWAAETVLLLWLSQKSGIKLMKFSSVIILTLMIISLILDWKETYFFIPLNSEPLPPIFNKGFITGIFAVVTLFLTTFFIKKEEDEFIIGGFKVKEYQELINILFIIGLYVTFFCELRYQLNRYVSYYATKDIIIGSYNLLFLLGLSFIARKKETPVFLETSVLLSLVGIVSYPMFYHFMTINVRNSYIHGHGELSSYIYHYINILLVLLLLLSTFKNILLKSFMVKEFQKGIMWLVCFIIIFVLSSELDSIIALSSDCSKETITYYINQNHKIGFPILWAICSFFLMMFGMRVKRRDLRIMSLSLFLIIILKLFIFDIRGISEGGKIAAFIFLGIILLIVSFMYQKLKKILTEDNSEDSIDNSETNSEEK